jgi:hypothetical protein
MIRIEGKCQYCLEPECDCLIDFLNECMEMRDVPDELLRKYKL